MNAIKNKVGNMKIKRSETSPLEKFKYQSALTKKFGKKSLIIYNAIPLRKYATLEEIKKDIEGFSDEEIEKILKFMEERGMISIKETKKEKKEERKEKTEMAQEKEEVSEIEEEKEIEIEKPVEEEKELEIEEKEAEEAPVQEEVENQPEEEIEITPAKVEEEASPETPEIEKEETEEPIEETAEEAPVQEEIESQPEEEIEITPAKVEENEEEEEVEISPAKIEEGTTEKEELSIKPISEDEGEGTEEKEAEEEKAEEEELNPESFSPLENELYEKFGEIGVRIYRKVKEGYTVEEIFNEFGEEKEKTEKVIEFLKELGYIEEQKKEDEEEREKFAPMSDYVEEEEKLQIDKENEVRYVENIDESLIKKAREKMLTSLKFGKEGGAVFDAIKKGVDIITIIKKTKIKLSMIEKILQYLEKDKYLKTGVYNREDIKTKFGEDSYIVYKKYGKIGLIFYELIGEDMHLKDIARLLEIKDKEKVVDIFMFIHDLLNIEVPIDKQLIMKKLE